MIQVAGSSDVFTAHLGAALRQWLEARGDSVHADVSGTFARLVAEDCDALPLPGGGQTLERWAALAEVAAADLSLVKLYEGHTDALAILAELGASPDTAPRGARWAVWAAENPQAPLAAKNGSGGELVLQGRKDWCSGASMVSHALVTASNAHSESVLAAVRLAQPGVRINTSRWRAVGMAHTGTAAVSFDGAHAWQIGHASAYLARPGFWHGGAGIAACWLGAAQKLSDIAREAIARRDDIHGRAHLGAMIVALQGTRALMRKVASRIDAEPRRAHRTLVMCLRASAEFTADAVLTHAGRALGAAPFCRDATFARHAADLPVFLRQSHAERDLAEIGTDVIAGAFDDLPG